MAKEGRPCLYGEPVKRLTVALNPKIANWIITKGNKSRFVNDVLRREKEKEENAAVS